MRLFHASNGPVGDLPPFEGTCVPYVIASTPRSGSTLLAEGLRATGLAGSPSEYFNPLHALDFARRWKIRGWKGRVESRALLWMRRDPLERWRARDVEALVRGLVRHRSTANGRFGVKTHHRHLSSLFLSRGLTVEQLLGPVQYLRIDRRDRVQQAVSMVRAAQTGQWSSEWEARGRLRYDADAIRRQLASMTAESAAWDEYFRARRIEPVSLVYEEFAADYAGGLRKVLAALGVTLGDRAIEPPKLSKQADETSMEWVDRFLRETGLPATG